MPPFSNAECLNYSRREAIPSTIRHASKCTQAEFLGEYYTQAVGEQVVWRLPGRQDSGCEKLYYCAYLMWPYCGNNPLVLQLSIYVSILEWPIVLSLSPSQRKKKDQASRRCLTYVHGLENGVTLVNASSGCTIELSPPLVASQVWPLGDSTFTSSIQLCLFRNRHFHWRFLFCINDI